MDQTVRIKQIAFNQDSSLFSHVENKKLTAHSVNDGKIVFSQEFDFKPLKVQLLYRTNIIGIINTEKPKILYIWDINKESNQPILELEFDELIRNFKINNFYIVVFLLQRVIIFRLRERQKMTAFYQAQNKDGVGAVNLTENIVIASFAEPSANKEYKGVIQIRKWDDQSGTLKQTLIEKHRQPPQYMKLTPDGLKLASVGKNGFSLRIFDTETGEQLQELKRGIDSAIFNGLSFSACSNYLMCTSNRGIGLFSVKLTQEEEVKNVKREAQGEEVIPNLIADEGDFPWTSQSDFFNQFNNLTNTKIHAAFLSEPYTLISVDSQGVVKNFVFDPINGGDLLERKTQVI